jgi:phosphoglycerate dehydrogenase-like enzyme
MAEHVLGVTIALARQLPAVLRYQTAHHWGQDVLEGSGRIRTLKGSADGHRGLGSIGLEIARLAAPFGLKISAIRRARTSRRPTASMRSPPPASTTCSRAAMWSFSPRRLTDATRCSSVATRWRDEPGAWLVNIGRGSCRRCGACRGTPVPGIWAERRSIVHARTAGSHRSAGIC